MRSVLGIDAAWTVTQPSGIALAVNRSDGWQLAAVEPSYSDFEGLADSQIAVGRRPVGSTPEPSTLLKASSSLLRDGKVDLVAIDIPLARTPICGRRAADNAVSKVYGGKKKCGTHSPTKTRPGEISRVLQEGFAARGYPLLTQTAIPPGLIEVYPHPALLELAQEPERLPYKIAKVRNYWPSCSPDERRLRLFEQWTKIRELLEGRVKGVKSALPELRADMSGTELKAYEDMLDAIVCVWVGICALDGHATPFGDRDSAIWIPAGAW